MYLMASSVTGFMSRAQVGGEGPPIFERIGWFPPSLNAVLAMG